MCKNKCTCTQYFTRTLNVAKMILWTFSLLVALNTSHNTAARGYLHTIHTIYYHISVHVYQSMLHLIPQKGLFKEGTGTQFMYNVRACTSDQIPLTPLLKSSNKTHTGLHVHVQWSSTTIQGMA